MHNPVRGWKLVALTCLAAGAAATPRADAGPIVVTDIERVNMTGLLNPSKTQLNLSGGTLQFTPALPAGIQENQILTFDVAQVTDGPPANYHVTLNPPNPPAPTLNFTGNPSASFTLQGVPNSFVWDKADSTSSTTVITGNVQLLGSTTTFTVGTTQFSLSGYAGAAGGNFQLVINGAVINPGGDGTWEQVGQNITGSFGIAAAPEPASLTLAAIGLGGLAFGAWWKRRRKQPSA